MASLFKCIFGPALYASYQGTTSFQAAVYKQNTAEAVGDMIARSVSFLMTLVKYVTIGLSPFIASHMMKNGYSYKDGAILTIKYIAGLGVLYYTAVIVRGFGRYLNRDYIVFRTLLERATTESSLEAQRLKVQQYDFEFQQCPVDFNVTTVGEKRSKDSKALVKKFGDGRRPSWTEAPWWYFTKAVATFIGRPLIYPGSLGLMQSALSQPLQMGRHAFITKHGGRRYKLQSWKGNHIDTMVVDRRSNGGLGNDLVVCCEGNAGFYEVGTTMTPLQAGYSVLGWNHPGFGGSTGLPYPAEEQDAIDTVMQFALHELNFKPENIIIFAWSIGGYTAAWAAKHYPDSKAVIMDASFDDILPLATPRMPEILEPIVRSTIRTHFNLNIAELLSGYNKGPMLFIRRPDDEIITTEPGVAASNRGIDLALHVLTCRYPRIFRDGTKKLAFDYLGAQTDSRREEMRLQYDCRDVDMEAIIAEHKSKEGTDFPSSLDAPEGDEKTRGQLALFLVRKHVIDYDSSHCTQLPTRYFVMPWDYRAVEMPY